MKKRMKFNKTDSLSPERQEEITNNYSSLIAELKKHRAEHKETALKKEIDLHSPAWVRVNPGPPFGENHNSYRLCIGFRNVGCKYRENDPLGLGCLMCGYYARTAFEDVDSQTIIEQFKVGLRRGCEETTGFHSIEFLNDGSFLNQEEFDQKTQSDILGIVSRMPLIGRVLIESRSEYIDERGLRFLLECLREDQLLEIGVGLESADDFVREVCINKGVTTEDFENTLALISSMESQYRNRISLVVYLIVKPAFLTHKECIEDIVSSLKYLRFLSDRHQVRIVPKLEPAAIANGTVLSMLHESKSSMFYYEPLNYWAILEILAKTAIEIGETGFEIRIGAREDMDDVVKAPAIYNKDGETFHPFDFVIYESIQKFNQHQNYHRLFAIVSEVYQLFNGVTLTNEKSSLMQWLEKYNIENSAIEGYMIKNTRFINEESNRQCTKHDIEFMVTIYAVLDIMEGYCSDIQELKERIDEALLEKDGVNLEKVIIECFEKVAPKSIVKVGIVDMHTGRGFAEVFFDVTNLLRAEKVSIWSRFVFKERNNFLEESLNIPGTDTA